MGDKKIIEAGLYSIQTKYETFYVIAYDAKQALDALDSRFKSKLENVKSIEKLTEYSHQIIIPEEFAVIKLEKTIKN